jgi:hypothetical protein
LLTLRRLCYELSTERVHLCISQGAIQIAKQFINKPNKHSFSEDKQRPCLMLQHTRVLEIISEELFDILTDLSGLRYGHEGVMN